MIKRHFHMALLLAAACMSACTGKNISGNYYQKHQASLDKIEKSYQRLSAQQSFTLAFTDKAFDIISLEINTDTISYIYEFHMDEARIYDTMTKYGLAPAPTLQLINDMKLVRCTWVNNFDYYVDEKKQRLIFMSVRPRGIQYPFIPTKYYLLAFFFQPQVFDDKGRLLDKKGKKRLRMINDAVFHRINNRVCYTIGERFR
ncbi:MAG: hypothetical protein JWQ27_2065 [Ferruginibacter sp.]|nr:hypothetical protein [Ferruginibacter sp.]